MVQPVQVLTVISTQEFECSRGNHSHVTLTSSPADELNGPSEWLRISQTRITWSIILYKHKACALLPLSGGFLPDLKCFPAVG